MHGHGHPETWVEIGYNLSGAQLGLSNTTLNGATYLALATVRTLAGTPRQFALDDSARPEQFRSG
jgi:hypothetical protein